MNDVVGRRLATWRIQATLPHIQGRLLDVGCGFNGLVSAYGNGVGVDVYPWPGVNQVIEDSSRLPFPEATFDTVSILAALNHIPNREATIRDCARVLKPGGRFLMTMITPRLSRVWHAIRKPWDADQHERGMHEDEVFGFQPNEVIKLVESGGLKFAWKGRFMFGLNRLYRFEKVSN